LRDQGVIDKYDVKRLNGFLFDAVATDVSKNHPKEPTNIFEDKERFFTTGIFRKAYDTKHPAAAKNPKA